MNTDVVYSIIKSISKGKVLTYKEVARRAGIKNPRLVGRILHQNPDPKTIPCHRVVKSDGTIACGYAFGGKEKQKELLKTEGVEFLNENKINLGASSRF